MKILITTDLYFTSTNGVVTSVRNLTEGLREKGHEVRILTVSNKMESYKEGDVYFVKSLPLGFVYPDVRMPISYRNYMIKELIDWKPDVIHSQCEFFTYQFAKRISKLTGAPLVHTYHTLYENYVKYVIPSERVGRRVVKSFSRYRLRKADVIIAPTGKVEDTLRGYGMKNHISVIPSGISLEQHHYRMEDAERNRKRKSLGIPEDHHVLLSLGRVGAEKNLAELIKFFATALQNNSKLTFLIVGDGPDRENLQNLSEKLGIQNNVIFTGMVNPSEVQQYYQLADIFMCASISETQGLTYIEAAANGLPLLCRQDNALRGIVIDGINGYQYTSRTDFLEKLDRIVSDVQWRKQAGKNSEEIAETFGTEHFAERIEDIYMEECHAEEYATIAQ